MSSTREALHEALAANIEAASIEVTGGDGGHFCIAITAPVFEGKSTLERHRLVLNSIKDLMAGHDAPVHAIDSIKANAS